MTYWRLYYHIIWGTRLREPVIDERRIETIERAMRLVSNEVHAILHAIGMMPDHVHVAISVPPKISISEFVQGLKGGSSRLVNISESELNLGTFRWQPEYGVVSFGEEVLPQIVSYVANQALHHAEGSLREKYESDGSAPDSGRLRARVP